MKYILMMHAGAGPYQVAGWTQEELGAHIKFMMDFNKYLVSTGEWVQGEGLAGPDQAKRVRAGTNGEPITDGVFPESKSSWQVSGSSTWTARSGPTSSQAVPRRRPDPAANR